MRRALATATVAAAVIAAASCRSSCDKRARSGALGAPSSTAFGSASATPRANAALARELCGALHALPGRRRAECCASRPSPLLEAECVRAVSASLEADAVTLDRDAVRACAAAMEASLAGCDWVTPSQPPSPPACQRLFRGRLAAGAVCRSSLECAGNLHCAGVTPTKTGRCTAPGADGAACGFHTDALAAYTLTRDLETSHPFCRNFCALTTHRCEPLPEPGAACAASVNCAPGQRCVDGRCSSAPARRLGEACDRAPCAAGMRCAAGRCAALARPGEACRSDFECALGGCRAGSDGAPSCGAKCRASLPALERASAAPRLGLPEPRR